MAKGSRLKRAAVQIGTAVGKADRTAHTVASAGKIVREELVELTKQIEALTRQLKKTSKRLKGAFRS